MKCCASVFLACLLISSVEAGVTITLQGQLGGESRTVDVSADGTLAYLGVGSRVVVLDLLDPNGAGELGKSQVLAEVVEDIVAAGDYAFVAAGLAGLYVLDVSDPAAPVVVGHYQTPSGSVGRYGIRGLRVSLSERHAFLCDGNYGLHILDVSNPAEPTCVTTLKDVDARDVEVAGGYAYVGTRGRGLLVFDVSDPAYPILAGTFAASDYFTEVEVSGGWLYATGDGEAPDYIWRLFVADLRSPSRPVTLGHYKLDSSGRLAVDGKTVYIANGVEGVEFLRVTKPAIPERIGRYRPGSIFSAVAARPGSIYVTGASGLNIVDVSNPVKPVTAGTYVVRRAIEVAVLANHAYVLSGGVGLHVADVSDPCNPRWVGSLTLGEGYASGLCAGLGRVWAGVTYQFTAVDVSNPLKPTITGACNTGIGVYDIATEGSYAYVVGGNGLAVLDISDPYKPALIGQYKSSAFASTVCVSGRYAYVGTRAGLEVIDVSNPAAPSRIGQHIASAWPAAWSSDIALYGNYAFLAHGNPNMPVIDISDPCRPERIRQITADTVHGVAIQDHYGYLADGRLGLRVFDVSSLNPLLCLGRYANAGFDKIAVAGDYVYAADGAAGLVILKVGKRDDSILEEVNPDGSNRAPR